MIAAILSALLLSQASPQTSIQAQEPVDLGEVESTGRTLRQMTDDFVREVGAPAAGRGLARWRDGVCVGVANLKPAAAQFIADRVSDRARSLGLTAGEPGCTPSVIIVATEDANAFTPAFVARRPRLFRIGGSGMDLGREALRRFQETDRPVRWWTVSLPVNETGQITTSIPGVCQDACGDTIDYAPRLSTLGSRLSSPIEDDIGRVFIIVDIDKISALSADQLADYLAMVTLAQVDPNADTSRYSTILNVFNDPQDSPGMTQWDEAYLKGLYQAERMRVNLRANGSEIASSIVRVRQAMDAADSSSDRLP